MPTLIDAFASAQMQALLILVAIDVVAGVLAAFVKKEFQFRRVAEFMPKMVVGYIFGFAVLQMAADALAGFELVVTVAFLLVVFALLASISRHLHRLGFPLPGAEKK